MRLPNPETVQFPEPSHPASALPLVLIHDGGGTTFAYHCLPPLSRPVYGIRNPRFESGGVWAGGVSEMASLYASMIVELATSPTFPRAHGRPAVAPRSAPAAAPDAIHDDADPKHPPAPVEILLGGWSLGGYLSLQISSLLPPTISVAGLILIDSPFLTSLTPSSPTAPTVHSTLPPLPPTATRSQRLARACIRNAPALLRGWAPPPPSAVPARAVLIKAQDKTPVAAPPPCNDDSSAQDEPRMSPVDRRRDDALLGWGAYGAGEAWLSAVVVRGHHFDIFEAWNIEGTGRAIEDACRVLEGRGG